MSNVAIETTPPPAGSYRYVMRRYDRDATIDPQAILFPTYGETVESRAVALGGRIAHTLFCREDYTRDRAMKLGWLDETAAWEAEHGSGANLAALLGAADGWRTVAYLADALGMTADALAPVLDAGLAAGTIVRRTGRGPVHYATAANAAAWQGADAAHAG